MPWNYSTAVKNNRLQQVVNAIDGGAGNGKIQIGTTSMALVLSTVTLLKPCGTISGGILTFSGTPITDPFATASGTAVAARVTDSTGTVVASGLTVGLTGSSADIIINLQNITAGSIVIFLGGTLIGN